jgi:four helix bundle protein
MEEAGNPLREKSFEFAIQIVEQYKQLAVHFKEYVLSKQLLRSGCSIGANINEAQNSESRADFAHKLGIAQKECAETIYWLNLLNKTNFITDIDFHRLEGAAIVILKILRSSILTVRKKSINRGV